MKKVFSVKKYEEVMKKEFSFGKKEIEENKRIWADKCDGLTAEEMMIKHCCLTVDDWMIEVEE